MYKLILASQSPRRRKLLQEAGYSFDIASIEISEILEKNLTLHEQFNDLSRRKARAIQSLEILAKGHKQLVIASDTEVIFEGEVLGKPSSKQEAFETLKRLSGRVHLVLTSVSVWDYDANLFVSGVCETKVFFKQLADKEIWSYVETGDPLDKAGSYGIQTVFMTFVEKIDGPFDNVVGFPMELVRTLLSRWKL